MSKQALSHVRWIGGSPCSGKSTISKLLGERYNLTVYNVDDHWDDHVARAVPERQPLLCRYRPHTDWDWVFVQRPVAEQVEAELIAYREEWALILEDLLALPKDRLIIAEGASMLPELVAPQMGSPRQALWLTPAEAFQRSTYLTQREGFVNWIAGQTSNPELAKQNWMDRDVAYARLIAADAEARGLRVEWVDGSRPISDMAALVAAHFQLG